MSLTLYLPTASVGSYCDICLEPQVTKGLDKRLPLSHREPPWGDKDLAHVRNFNSLYASIDRVVGFSF